MKQKLIIQVKSKSGIFVMLLFGFLIKVTDVRASHLATTISQGTGISVTGGTAIGSYVVTNTAPYIAPSFNNAPSITLNSSSQISTTKNCRCTYSVTVTTAVSLLTGTSSGQAFLEISANNSTWTEINRAGNTSTLTVAITVSVGATNSYNLQGDVPAGYYRRIRTTTSGGGAVAYNSGQEVSY
jgi:hypothetical protein